MSTTTIQRPNHIQSCVGELPADATKTNKEKALKALRGMDEMNHDYRLNHVGYGMFPSLTDIKEWIESKMIPREPVCNGPHGCAIGSLLISGNVKLERKRRPGRTLRFPNAATSDDADRRGEFFNARPHLALALAALNLAAERRLRNLEGDNWPDLSVRHYPDAIEHYFEYHTPTRKQMGECIRAAISIVERVPVR